MSAEREPFPDGAHPPSCDGTRRIEIIVPGRRSPVGSGSSPIGSVRRVDLVGGQISPGTCVLYGEHTTALNPDCGDHSARERQHRSLMGPSYNRLFRTRASTRWIDNL